MILAIDIGNTTIEFGAYNGQALIGPFRIGTKMDITSDEIWLYLAQFFERQRIPPDDIRHVVISSVVPQINYPMQSAIRKYHKREPYILGENCPVDMPILYDDPNSLGIDRLVDAYAAFQLCRTAAVVVDFGTATTCDAVSAKGEFLGGSIFPGIRTSVDALYGKAAKLPKSEIVKPTLPIGRNTEDCLQLGAYYGYLGAVEKMVGKMKAAAGQGAKVVTTGGFSRLFAEEPVFDLVEPHLQLLGIRLIFEKYLETQL